MDTEKEKATTQEDGTELKLDKVDSYLTKFGLILKKHWGKLLLLLVSYCVYWAFTQPATPAEKTIIDTVIDRDTIIIK